MHTYSLTQAELVVLTQHIVGDELILGQTAQADLGVDPAQLHAAEASLRQRGWLPHADAETVSAAEELAQALETTIFPDRVAIMRTTLPNNKQPAIIFSWRADQIVRNTVDEHGRHEFSVLDSFAATLDEIMAAGMVPRYVARAASGATAALETLIASMQTLTMLMVVEQPVQPEPVVRNLSWLTADGSLWLVDGKQAANRQARRVDRSVLRQKIAAELHLL